MFAKFKYKCRLCGESYFNGLESGEDVANMAMTTLIITGRDYNAVMNKTMSVTMLDSHYCNGYDKDVVNYQVGVADLIGYEVSK